MMNEFIVENVQPDVLVWSGDIVSHDFWNYDQDFIELYEGTFAEEIKKSFPNTPMYPVSGNHDFALLNS